MDGSGNAENGYVIRGGREMEFTYENFWDVFQDIPAVEMHRYLHKFSSRLSKVF